jgi:hypothetical protein
MLRKLDTVLDVMRVPSEGDPRQAIRNVDHEASVKTIESDVLVVGGGLGGVAAALAASRRGRSVCLVEETDWLGGQATAQGVSALDEHLHIESFGGTRSYYDLRETIRNHYRSMAAAGRADFNPGRCWVSHLSFEPIVAVTAIEEMLRPAIDSGQLQVYLRTKAVAADVDSDWVQSIRTLNLDDGTALEFRPAYLIDATELGDLLPLVGAEHAVGAETIAETGEPSAQPEDPHPQCVQSCTYTFALERRPENERHAIARPTKYEHYRDGQPYDLRIEVHGGEIYGEASGWLQYAMFDTMDGTKGGLWQYRRLVDAAQFPGRYDNDITMFNWPGIDYRDKPLTDQSAENLATALQDAKRVSLGFVHWLQTDVTDPSGARGFPSLRLHPETMGSQDGLSKHPYIREGRRLRALHRVVEQDVAVAHHPGPRARHFDDSVGVGWYPIDIHQAGEGDVGVSTRTKPFQIPMGALIPVRLRNLIAGNKNIGTTHITNGCYRLHPVEWNVGEVAGTLASFALDTGQPPQLIHSDRDAQQALQRALVDDGIPLAWTVDVPVSDPDFAAVQRLVMAGGYGGRDATLEFGAVDQIDAADRRVWLDAVSGSHVADPCGTQAVTRATFARALAQAGLT